MPIKHSNSDKPRKGTFHLANIADTLADEIRFHQDELLPSKIKKIECRFKGATPEFVAIIHTEDGSIYAVPGNSEYLGETDYEEISFNPEKHRNISDSIACPYAVYTYLISDIPPEEFEENFKISRSEYRRLKKEYNDHTADFVI